MPRRPGTTARGYGGRWAKLSRAMRARHPYCSLCGRTDDLTVDHLDERDSPTAIRSTAPDRLRVLCRPCNTRRQNAANELRGIVSDTRTLRVDRPRTSRPRGALADDP